MVNGRKPSVTTDDTLQAVFDRGERVVTSGEMADDLGVSRKTAYRRLEELVDTGEVEKKRLGERLTVYWLNGRVKQHMERGVYDRDDW